VALSFDQFVQDLSRSGLISAADLKPFLDGLGASGRAPDAETLAQL
jgi:hypothetical protein